MRFERVRNCKTREVAIDSVRFQRFLVFLRVEIHSGHGLDPAKMIVNLLDAGNTLRRNNRCLPRSLIGDHTAEMNITVMHDDAEPEWPPVSFLDRCDDVVANMIVIGSRIRALACEFCNSLKEIGARYDPDKLISALDRQTLEVVALHQHYNVFERRILRHSAGVKSHDVPNLAAPLVHEVRCYRPRAEKEFQPATALSLGSYLRAADKVTLRDDADQLSGFVDYWKSTDVVLQHYICGIND